MLVDLNKDNYEEIVASNKVIVFDFWAEWCGPCKQFKPVFESVSNMDDMKDVVFAKVDVESNRDLAGKFGIRSIPTIVFMKDGVIVHSVTGVIPEAPFVNAVESLKNAEI